MPHEPSTQAVHVHALTGTPAVLDTLADLLVDVVAHGGSVGFMHPLPREQARAFWERALGAAERGERVVLGGWADGQLVGTVTLILDCPPNQPHRAEIAKMMTHPAWRGRGVASTLMRAAENLAARHARTLLVLDTAEDGGAGRLYERLGFHLTGLIPDYALKPHGGLTGTLIYWKRLTPSPPDR